MAQLSSHKALNISVADDSGGSARHAFPFDAQSNALEYALLAFLAYTLCFHATEVLVARKPSLLPRDITDQKKYEAIYHFILGGFRLVALVMALPAHSSLVEFVTSDSLVVMLPNAFVARLLKIAGAVSIMPVIADLAARRNISGKTFLHHVLTCIFVVICIGWRDAASIGVFYAVTCYLSFVLVLALAVCDVQARPEIAVWWLSIATWTTSVGFALGQTGILSAIFKIYRVHSAKEDANVALVNVSFAVGLSLALVLNATQWKSVHVIHSMAQRRKAQLKAKTL